MIKRLLIIVALATIALGLFPLVWGMQEARTLSGVARYYVVNGAEDYGAANLVTAVVVSYRGLDTLGEVAVLFVATAGIVLLLGSAKEPVLLDRKSHAEGESEPEPDMGTERREGSPLLKTGAALLFPIILLFGVYIFVNGHLTPGGGFQGGVVIASAVVLLLMANSEMHMKHGLLNMIEARFRGRHMLLSDCWACGWPQDFWTHAFFLQENSELCSAPVRSLSSTR